MPQAVLDLQGLTEEEAAARRMEGQDNPHRSLQAPLLDAPDLAGQYPHHFQPQHGGPGGRPGAAGQTV